MTRHTEAALVGKLMRAYEGHTEVTVDLVGIRGYVVAVSTTGASATVWDGEKEVDVPVWAVKDVRPPEQEDGEPVPTPARRRVSGPTAEQIALDFGNEQMGFKF